MRKAFFIASSKSADREVKFGFSAHLSAQGAHMRRKHRPIFYAGDQRRVTIHFNLKRKHARSLVA